MSFRGVSGIEAQGRPKVYVDGVPVASDAYGVVDPQSIERMEVIRGPQAAAIYGSDALAGVIQIFTKRGSEGRRRPEVQAQAALGVIESEFEGSGALRQEYSATVRGGSTNASYSLGGSYSRTGDWIPEYGVSSPRSGFTTGTR